MILDSFLPKPIIAFLIEIEDLGFSLCIVGGAVRDYLARGSVSQDLDFEIRANQKISDEAWPDYYSRLPKFLEERKIKVTTFPYLITKIDFNGWSLEFSSPRIEKFEDENTHTHHNFKAALSSNLSYGESYRRRDFTLNAIGLELNCKKNTMKIIDPYDGQKDLKEKILKNIDENFFKDSVRFLRLIRFSVKYEMSINTSIEKKIGSFNLSSLSKYHFAAEMFKTDPGQFLDKFRDYVKKYNLQLPEAYDIWLDDKFNWPLNIVKSKEDLLAYVFQADKAAAEMVLKFFSLPVKKLKELKKMSEIK